MPISFIFGEEEEQPFHWFTNLLTGVLAFIWRQPWVRETTGSSFGEQGKKWEDPTLQCCHLWVITWWLPQPLASSLEETLPNARIFSVNWFWKMKMANLSGRALAKWVLQWIINRVKGRASAVECPIGWIPRYRDMDFISIGGFYQNHFKKVMSINRGMETGIFFVTRRPVLKTLGRQIAQSVFSWRELLLSALWRSPEKMELAREGYKLNEGKKSTWFLFVFIKHSTFFLCNQPIRLKVG